MIIMALVTAHIETAKQRLAAAGFDEAQIDTAIQAISVRDGTLLTKDRLDSKINRVLWMLSALIAIAIANFAKQFF